MIEIEGVGSFIKYEEQTQSYHFIHYICETDIGKHDQVELIMYGLSSVSVTDQSYQALATEMYTKLHSSLNEILGAADSQVRDLAESYDAHYIPDWADRLELKIVRITYDEPVSLSLTPTYVRDEPSLFHGLDLNLSLDRNGNILDVWFDG